MRAISNAGAVQSGSSLMELVVALLLTALVFAALLPWFTRPFEALAASHAAASAADQAERATARFAAEIANALPNSTRVACAGRCIEFLPVRSQGDYRRGVPGDVLDFGAADNSFDVLMALPATPPTGALVVINNLSAASTGSQSAYSADSNNNRASIVAGTTAAQIRISPKQFPAPSLRQRFHVVDTPVSYYCVPAASGGVLRRHAGYAIQSLQPVNTALGQVLADRMLDCQFSVADGRLVTWRLRVGTAAADAVDVLAQFRLVNTP